MIVLGKLSLKNTRDWINMENLLFYWKMSWISIIKTFLVLWGENNLKPRSFFLSSTKYQNMAKNKYGLLKYLKNKTCLPIIFDKTILERGGIEEYLPYRLFKVTV